MRTKFDVLAEAVKQRDAEIFSYQVNIDNYRRIISKITNEWTDETNQYRNATIETIAIGIDDESTRTLVSDLLFKDRLIVLLRTEVLEQRKAIQVRDAIQSQLEEM